MKRNLILGTIAFVLSWILWCAPLLQSSWDSVDLFCLDSWIRLASHRLSFSKNHVILVAIDDPSLREMGPWPWPRKLQAQLIQKIASYGAKAIGIDLIYDKPKTGDLALARSIAQQHVVLAAYTDENSGLYLKGHGLFVEHIFLPSPLLADQAYGIGHIVINYDPDGIARRVPAFLASPNHSLPSFALALALAARGEKPAEVHFQTDRLQMGSLSIPLDEQGNFFIGYLGGPRTLPWISAAQVLKDQIPTSVFKDKVVLIGVTATKFAKKWATPFVKEGPMSGVEIQAQIVESILRNHIPSLLPKALLVVLAWSLAILAAFLAGMAPVILVCWLLIPALFFTWALGAWLYIYYDYILLVVPVALAISLSFLNVFAFKAWQYRRGLAERTAQLGALFSLSQHSSLKGLCLLLKDLTKAQEVHGIFKDHRKQWCWIPIPKKKKLPQELLEKIFVQEDAFLIEEILQQWLKRQEKTHLLVPIRSGHAQGWYILFRPSPFSLEEQKKALQFASLTALLLEKETLRAQLQATQRGIVKMWLKNLAKQVPSLYKHSLLVAHLARQLAQKLDLPAQTIEEIYEAGLLHDLGLFGAPEELFWEEQQTPEARMWIESHPIIGAELLQEVPGFTHIAQIIRQHHERFDGRGFPEGLKGNEISLEARILALAEGVATAMGQKYRQGKSWETIKKEIYQELGRDTGERFDPRIVHVFLNLKWEWQNGRFT